MRARSCHRRGSRSWCCTAQACAMERCRTASAMISLHVARRRHSAQAPPSCVHAPSLNATASILRTSAAHGGGSRLCAAGVSSCHASVESRERWTRTWAGNHPTQYTLFRAPPSWAEYAALRTRVAPGPKAAGGRNWPVTGRPKFLGHRGCSIGASETTAPKKCTNLT